MLDKIVYAKTLAWRHENEYRLVIPVMEGEKPWNTLLFHPDEITELYLGLAMERADSDEIQCAARAINPGVAVFKAKRGGDGKLDFDRV